MGIAVDLISNQYMMRICCSQERNIYQQATMSASINILTTLQTEVDRLTGGLTSYILLRDTRPSIVGSGEYHSISAHNLHCHRAHSFSPGFIFKQRLLKFRSQRDSSSWRASRCFHFCSSTDPREYCHLPLSSSSQWLVLTSLGLSLVAASSLRDIFNFFGKLLVTF